FYVLYLLAHLFDQHLDLERRLRQFRVYGLGAERIGFAVELLHQKVESFAAASTLGQYAPHLGDVGGKARDFLGDVDFGGEQRELLLQAIVVRIEPGFLEPRAKLFDIGFVNDRHPRHYAFELRLDATTALFEHELKLRALARPRRREIAECLPDQRQLLVGQRFCAQRRLSEHAWPTQDFDNRKRSALWRVTQHFVGRVAELDQSFDIDGKFGRARRGTIQRDPAVDLPTLQLNSEYISNGRFD